jgi:hypothetical protein
LFGVGVDSFQARIPALVLLAFGTIANPFNFLRISVLNCFNCALTLVEKSAIPRNVKIIFSYLFVLILQMSH